MPLSGSIFERMFLSEWVLRLEGIKITRIRMVISVRKITWVTPSSSWLYEFFKQGKLLAPKSRIPWLLLVGGSEFLTKKQTSHTYDLLYRAVYWVWGDIASLSWLPRGSFCKSYRHEHLQSCQVGVTTKFASFRYVYSASEIPRIGMRLISSPTDQDSIIASTEFENTISTHEATDPRIELVSSN